MAAVSYTHLAEEIARQEELARVYRVSEQLLRDGNQITFSGQLLQAVQRLQSDPELLEKLRARYRYVLVDEFQDTNIVQIELLWLCLLYTSRLAALNPAIVVAGHKKPGAPDSPSTIEDTKRYLQDFDRVKKTATSDQELFDQMTELYPHWVANQSWLLFGFCLLYTSRCV